MAKKNVSGGNKIVAARFGAVASIQSEVEERFEKLVVKGEAARKDYRASINKVRAEVRGDIKKQFNNVKNRVVSIYEAKAPIKIGTIVDRIDDVRETVTTRASDLLNIPTSKDIDALNKKLDKVIRKVAA